MVGARVAADGLALDSILHGARVEDARADTERRDLRGERDGSADELRLREALRGVHGKGIRSQPGDTGCIVPECGGITIDRGHGLAERDGARGDGQSEYGHAVDAAVPVATRELRGGAGRSERQERYGETSCESVHCVSLSG